MSKKNSTDPNKVLRWELYKASPILSEKYPNIKSLIIEQTFHDDSGTKQIGQKVWNVPLDTTRAHFYIDCPMRECVDGGFDLTQAVISTIEKHETVSTGRLAQVRHLKNIFDDIWINFLGIKTKTKLEVEKAM